mmetsp:Transcript_14170/g.42758  ORF Transcript_14170/g.42758 Transcript_14170/m.42758 type:complete len:363 (+) Transcript_14170:93-1181(+)|eukprot:CAMPEP_0206148758 /NCGR_PEP_ID=MMETSP1473-20131121/37419_1 /ASSEMBLY_ACC=CAM_ASM_001109 /TAXON_ID=1461547 /ORGANISM="Stichococcus sp, Strain RCC1054" /LENGTH=362 /DNA_ID=CAMNT_0053546181 /DNA_START=87 /DNA_END=1175 /DNA_ORIENTATION=+
MTFLTGQAVASPAAAGWGTVSTFLPKGLRSPLPQRCKAAGKQGGHLPTSRSGLSGLRKARLQEELTSRGLDASGNKPILVSRLHEALTLDDMDVEVSGMAAQRLSPLEREAAPVEVNHELLALREKVQSLDKELHEVQTLLSQSQTARHQEQERLAELQMEMTSLQAGWASDKKALETTLVTATSVEDSAMEVRDLQAQCVSLGERVVRLQTLLVEKDDLIAELRTKLLEVRPKQFALAGAAGQMSLEDMVMAGLGSGATLPAPVAGRTGAMLDISTSAEAAPRSHRLMKPALKSNILKSPAALGVGLVGGTLAAADAASDIWGSVRRLAPAKQRPVLDTVASVVTSIVAATALWALNALQL